MHHKVYQVNGHYHYASAGGASAGGVSAGGASAGGASAGGASAAGLNRNHGSVTLFGKSM